MNKIISWSEPELLPLTKAIYQSSKFYIWEAYPKLEFFIRRDGAIEVYTIEWDKIKQHFNIIFPYGYIKEFDYLELEEFNHSNGKDYYNVLFYLNGERNNASSLSHNLFIEVEE